MIQVFNFLIEVNITHSFISSASFCRLWHDPYPNSIRSKLEIAQLEQPFQPLDCRDLVLYKVDIRQVNQMRDVLDVLDFVETQVQAGQVTEFIQTLDVRDKVVIEVEFFHGLGNVRREINALYLILSKT